MSTKQASPAARRTAPTAPDRAPPPSRAPDARRSAETVEKRRAARAFNEALLGPKTSPDGRSERRRRRLLRELEAHARGETPLKPVEVLVRVDALLALETPIEDIERSLPPPAPVPLTAGLAERLRALDAAYAFRDACYRFVGLTHAPGVRKTRSGRGPARGQGAA